MKLVVICGPTAGGKSELALETACRLRGEIITADSMQLYKGLAIGTAKPGKEERAKVPHHLLDLFDISERLDVFRYVALAETAIREIHGRGNTPFVVGGTGMYIRALLYGLDPLPSDSGLRAKLDIEFDNEPGFEKLKTIMSAGDPLDFQRWKQHRRKLIRALEVFELTGKSITELQKTWNGAALPKYDVFSRKLVWDRDALKQRISKRTDAMLASGWIDEAREMKSRGLLTSPTAHQALGYKIIAAHLEGKIDFETVRARIVTETWQFARRQITWFKNKHPESLPLEMPADAGSLASEIKSFACIS
ncbi:MAG TPA: tRNA (adenosine(37)-N6)-dimethylallyltransferase MiaA [Lentisphaeria bacterium]|nr:MAG: tRNA (adenosine(37)-N6)-dimethylallyltransferase MiaA [Lentisphaerae bacterium GWF2_49_21]HBC86354.1 tRNA (adenosine(37)-N6)-dimethylallyltransferase MiaA [Lentisphaeria bacterium]